MKSFLCIKSKWVKSDGRPRILFLEGKFYSPRKRENKLMFNDQEFKYKHYPVKYTKKHLEEFFQFKFKYGK
jgi:hypothetical protein